uniref:Pre-mRNA-splicing factor SYF2 n=1 Tax=Cyprinus carpio TaxID=7962 RepID=A0A8C1UH66_CYPCA
MASSAEVVAPSTEEESTETPAAQKREERLRKFRELHFKRNEARKLNHQEVVEEDKRLKLPSNWEAKKARLEYELMVDQKKKECAEQGEDYDRVKLLEISAEDAERWERKKKKKNPDPGFSGYAEAQLRQYQRLTKQIKPDMDNYEKQREECGEDFHPTSNSLIHGTHVPSKESIDRMVDGVEKHALRARPPVFVPRSRCVCAVACLSHMDVCAGEGLFMRETAFFYFGGAAFSF